MTSGCLWDCSKLRLTEHSHFEILLMTKTEGKWAVSDFQQQQNVCLLQWQVSIRYIFHHPLLSASPQGAQDLCYLPCEVWWVTDYSDGQIFSTFFWKPKVSVAYTSPFSILLASSPFTMGTVSQHMFYKSQLNVPLDYRWFSLDSSFYLFLLHRIP